MKLSALALGQIIALLVGADQLAVAQSDVMVGWQSAASLPNAATLVWSETPALTPAAIEDLTELRSAIVALGHPRTAVLVSENGRSVASTRAKNGDDPAQPAGVTIWADWKNPDAFINFADASQVQFLSNNHVLLSQHPAGGPYLSYVADLRRPTTRFQFTGYQLDTLRVTDAGKWAALATDGSLNSGELDPAAADGTATVTATVTVTVTATVTATAVPFSNTIRNLLWRKDGRVLLVERDGPAIDALLAKDRSVVASIAGGLGPDKTNVSPAGRDSCLGYQIARHECVFTISSIGGIVAEQWPHQVAGETGVFVSPLRRFVTTQRQDANGYVRSFCRKTPDSTADDVVPAWPAVPAGTKIQGFGWLLWEP